MDSEFWIRIIDDQVPEGYHPMPKQNIIDAFPHLNGDFTGLYAPVDLTPAPMLLDGEILEGPFYKWNDSHDKIINYYNIIRTLSDSTSETVVEEPINDNNVEDLEDIE